MTQQEFLKEFSRREFYYLEHNYSIFLKLKKHLDDYRHLIPSRDESDFKLKILEMSHLQREDLAHFDYYDEISSYEKQFDRESSDYYEKMNKYIDELESRHPTNKYVQLASFIFNPKYNDAYIIDYSISVDDNLRYIAEKFYERNREYDLAHKAYCAIKDYKNARRVRYSQASHYFHKGDYEKAEYYYRCALDYNDAEVCVECIENIFSEHKRFKEEVPNDYIITRLKQLQPKLYDEYITLCREYKSIAKMPRRVEKRRKNLYEELYRYVSDIEDKLVEEYSEKVDENIVLDWVGELPAFEY